MCILYFAAIATTCVALALAGVTASAGIITPGGASSATHPLAATRSITLLTPRAKNAADCYFSVAKCGNGYIGPIPPNTQFSDCRSVKMAVDALWCPACDSSTNDCTKVKANDCLEIQDGSPVDGCMKV